MTSGPDGEAAARPPDFTLRVSKRARHVRLVVTTEGELVVVVPRRFDKRNLPAIVEAKRTWIERAQTRVASRRTGGGEGDVAERGLPERIVLPALGEEWQVEYRSGGGRAIAREAPGGTLIVSAPTGEEDAYRRALLAWLQRRARTFLVPRLEGLSLSCRLRFEQATVRHQRTRWASCSPRGAISLNLRLLFLEPVLVDHVLIHELCHTRELNHSRRFWALMEAYDPDWAAHRRQIRDAWRSLPPWVRPPRATPDV